jgi:tetratricopeptide (TPR) repeat protein
MSLSNNFARKQIAALLTILLVLPSVAQTPTFSSLATQADAARDADQLDRAVPLYRKALALRPTWKEGWWSLGTILYDQSAYAPAAAAFHKLVAQDPNNGTAHLMLALCEYQLNQDDAALHDIDAAKKLGTRKDEQLINVLHYHEAMLLLRKDRFEAAREALRFLVNNGVHSDEVNAALAMCALLLPPKNVSPGGTPEHQFLQRIGQAESLAMQKKYDDAEKAYADLVRESPDFPGLHYAYGRVLLTMQNSEPAISQFQQEIKINPNHIRARLEIASAYYRTDSAAGIPFAEQAVKLQPKYPFGHYLLGLLYFDAGDTDRAIPQLEAASRMIPQEPQFYFALGNAYAKAGRKQDAARARANFTRLKAQASPPPAITIYGDPPNHEPIPSETTVPPQ